MTKAYFITGTDTGVGKTFVTAAIARALRARGKRVGVMKPIESGCAKESGQLVPKDAIAIREAAASTAPLDKINPYRFEEPISPHLAARISGETIELDSIKKIYEELASGVDVMLVEGAGGLLAPITDRLTMADLAKELKLPMVVVAASKLGVLNHTLLTVHYAESMDIFIKGIIVNHPIKSPDESRRFNADELKKLLSEVLFLGEIPYLDEEEAGNYKAEGLAVEVF